MSDSFDPYHKWLGIAPDEQPADHYRLLGIKRFESDPDVIQHAADQRMAHVRTFQAGKRAAESQQILNEVAAARICLLDSEKKAEYDVGLSSANVGNDVPPVPLAPDPILPEAVVPEAVVPEAVAPEPLRRDPIVPDPIVHPVSQPRVKVRARRGPPIPAIALVLLFLLVAIPVGLLVLSGGSSNVTSDEEAAHVDPGRLQKLVRPEQEVPPSTDVAEASEPSEVVTPLSAPEATNGDETGVAVSETQAPVSETSESAGEEVSEIAESGGDKVGETATSDPPIPTDEVTLDELLQLRETAADARQYRDLLERSSRVADRAVADGQQEEAKEAYELALWAARKVDDPEMLRNVTVRILDWQAGD